MEADEWSFGEPQCVMVIVKKGFKSTADGWICEFERKMKVVMIDANDSAKAKHRPPGKRKPRPSTDLQPADDVIADVDEGEFSDVPSSRWGESAKDESESNGGDTPDAKGRRDTFLICEDDRRDMTQEMRGFIDEGRYVVYTSRINQRAVRWRDKEKRASRSNRQEAAGKLQAAPGAKTLHAFRTSNVSRRTFPERMKRAHEWQNWRSNKDWYFYP